MRLLIHVPGGVPYSVRHGIMTMPSDKLLSAQCCLPVDLGSSDQATDFLDSSLCPIVPKSIRLRSGDELQW